MTRCTEQCRFNDYIKGCMKSNLEPCPLIKTKHNYVEHDTFVITFDRFYNDSEVCVCRAMKSCENENTVTYVNYGSSAERLKAALEQLLKECTDVL